MIERDMVAWLVQLLCNCDVVSDSPRGSTDRGRSLMPTIALLLLSRRQQQDEMIERDMVAWLVQLLHNCDVISDYMVEYAVALLMNLCLRTAGQLCHE